jgi:hypothetical protein
MRHAIKRQVRPEQTAIPGGKAMNKDEKMWYSIEDVLAYLNIEENSLYKKMIFLNIESRSLPGLKGQFISKRDVDAIKLYMAQKNARTD